MASLKELIVKIGADTTGLTSGIDAAQSKIASFGDSATKLGGAMTAAFTVPLAGLGTAAITVAGQFEQTRLAFETMLGSADAATKFIDDLKAFAAGTPFEFQGLVDAAKRMQAFGFEAGEVIPILTNVGDAVAGLGGGDEVLNRVVTALGQIQAKGKLSAEEINQLAEAGINARQSIADSLGVAVPEAMALIEKGSVDANTAIQAILTGMENDFGGLMEKQAQTFLGQLSNIKDQLFFILQDLGTAILPVATSAFQAFAPFVDTLGNLATAFGNLDPGVQTFIVTLGALLAAAGPVIAAIGLLATGIAAVGLPIAGTVAGIAAITAAIAGLSVWFSGSQSIEGPIGAAFDAIKTKIGDSVDKFIASFDRFTAALSKAWTDLGMDTIVAATWDAIKLVFGQTLTAIGTVLSSGLNVLSGILDVFTGVLTGDWGLAWDGIKTIVSNTIAAIVAIVDPMGAASAAVAKAKETVGAIKQAFVDGLKEATGKVGEFVGNVYDGFVNLKTKLLDNSPVPDIINGISTAFSTLGGENMVTPATNATNATLSVFQGLADKTTGEGGLFTNWANGVKSIVTSLNSDIVGGLFSGDFDVEGMKTKLQNIAQSFVDVFKTKALEGINGLVNDGINFLMGKLDDLIAKLTGSGGVQGAFNAAFGGGGSAAGGVAGGGGGSIPSGGGGGGAGSSAGGIGGAINVVTGIATAISSIFGNFQMAAMNATLDLIEEQVRRGAQYLGDRGDGGIIGQIFKTNELLGWGPTVKAVEATRDYVATHLGPIEWAAKAIETKTDTTIGLLSETGPVAMAIKDGNTASNDLMREILRMLQDVLSRPTVIEVDGQELGRVVGAGQAQLAATA